MTETELTAAGEPTRGRSIVKLLLGVAGLYVLLFLLTLVPPFERQVPGTPVTVEALSTAVVTVVIFGLLVVVADQLGELTHERLAGAPEERFPSHAGAAVKYTLVFLAFLVMYEPVARATVPFLVQNGTPWVYDLAFSVVSVVLLALAAYYAFRCLDPVAERVSGTFLDGDDASTASERDGTAGDRPTAEDGQPTAEDDRPTERRDPDTGTDGPTSGGGGHNR